MRVPVLFTAALLAVALGWGWYDHQRLVLLRGAQADLVAKTSDRGLPADLDGLANLPRPSKRPRIDRAAEARQTASSFIAYGKDMQAHLANGENFNHPDDALRHRMMEELDRVLALDGDQLKILIGEIHLSKEIDDKAKESLLRFAMNRLIKDYPKDALMILTGTPGLLETMRRTNGVVEGALFSSLRGWAKLDPDAARTWLQEQRGTFPSQVVDKAADGLIFGVADHDVRLALKLVEEYGKNPSSFLTGILLREGQSREQRNESLAAYREWKTTPDAERLDEEMREEILPGLVFGRGPYRNTFEDAVGWMDQAALTPQELDFLCQRLVGKVKSEETGQWLAWLDTKLPPATARSRAWELFRHWMERDFEEARQWVTATAPDTPAKHTATRAYAEKLFPDQPQEAIRIALSVPPGEYRQITLQRLYKRWPKNDDASRKAAEAFASENGLQK